MKNKGDVLATPTPLAKECPHCQEYIDEKDFDQHVKDCPPTCDWYKDYDEFWKPLLEKDGVLDMNQLKKELYDYNKALKNVSKVYMHITNDKLSKINYDADTIISEADRCESDRTLEGFRKVFEEVLNELNVTVKVVIVPEGLDVLSYDLTQDIRLIARYPNIATEEQIKECRKVFEEADIKVVFVPKELEIKQEDE